MLLNMADVRYTFRLLAKKPAFTLLSILVLAGGLGISLIAFTMTYTLMFKTIPLQNGASIHQVCYAHANLGCRAFNAFEFAQLRTGISSLENIGIYQEQFPNLMLDDEFHTIRAVSTEWNMFELSGTRALLGRTLQPSDQQAGAETVVVLSHELWQSLYNLDEAVLGTVINLAGAPARVVGVMPQDYRFPWATDLWLPVKPEVLNPLQRDRTSVNVYAHLKPAYKRDAANAELAALMKGVRETFPPDPGRFYANDNTFYRALDEADTAHIKTLPMASVGGIESVVLIGFLNFLCLCILLLSSINVGTLLLARTNERLKDVSIRVALGAPRTRLLLQTMGEGVCICLCGGVMGLLFAGATLELLNVFFDSISAAVGGRPLTGFWLKFHLDVATLFATLLFLGLTILCTSVLPCWRIINGNFNAVMRDGTRGALGLRAGRFSRELVLTAITLITLLMYIGSITYAEVARIKEKMFSVPPTNMLGAWITLGAERYDDEERGIFYRSLANALSQEELVSAVQIGANVSDRSVVTRLDNAGNSAEGLAAAPVSALFSSSENSRPQLLEGRHLDARDRYGAPLVAVISESLAEQLWPDKSAVGESIRVMNNQPESTGNVMRVVGVVSDVPNSVNPLIDSDRAPIVIVPVEQAAVRRVQIRVTARENGALEHGAVMEETANVLARHINTLDPLLTFQVANYEDEQQTILRFINFGINLGIGVLVFALLIALAGIYGLTQNSVQIMAQEIGTRRALGATDRMIRNMMLWRGSKQVLIGFALAMLLSSPLTVVLFFLVRAQQSSTVLPYVMLAMLALYLVVYLAIYTPVRKLLLMEPGEALRNE